MGHLLFILLYVCRRGAFVSTLPSSAGNRNEQVGWRMVLGGQGDELRLDIRLEYELSSGCLHALTGIKATQKKNALNYLNRNRDGVIIKFKKLNIFIGRTYTIF